MYATNDMQLDKVVEACIDNQVVEWPFSTRAVKLTNVLGLPNKPKLTMVAIMEVNC